ncbi:ATP-binding protein [Streptomyces sp. RLB1-9]|uniref:ATP-binding protein n=1 Tax=Streptomyces sp. RLB1-9 TaxID=2594454 RepID=UPI0013DCF518|nr:ATP-binding protein [Streptomyces sp. RLB1-9]
MHSPTRQGPPNLASLGNIRFTQAYRKEPESVPLARQRFREAAHDGKLDVELFQRAELCLCELAANAVRHAHDPRRNNQILTEVTIRVIRRRPHLEISVWDIDGRRIPDIPNPDTAALQLADVSDGAIGGRGLLLIAAMTDEIGYDLRPQGKRIWCRWAL